MYKNPESLALAIPFSRSYWRTALRELQNLRMLTLAAIVVALRIVLSGLYIPLGDNLNIFFGYFVNSLGAAIYGPVVALLSGFATDVLGYFVHPTGPFFPGYVLSPCWAPSSTPSSSTVPVSPPCGWCWQNFR